MSDAVARQRGQEDRAGRIGDESELIVLASGNLGLVYAPNPERMTLEADRNSLAGARARPGRSPGYRLRGRDVRRRPGGHRRQRAATTWRPA